MNIRLTRSLIALSLSLLLLGSLPVWIARAHSEHDDDSSPERHQLFRVGSPHELRHARRLAREYLRQQREAFGLDQRTQLKPIRSWIDELAMAHVRVQQTFDDVPVFGGQAIVHLKADGRISQMTNFFVKNLAVNTTPSLTEAAAVEFATASLGCRECEGLQPKAQLWVLRREGVDRLVYEVRLGQLNRPGGPTMPVYFVDAHTGEIVWTYDNLQTATGTSRYSGNVSFNSYFKGSNYYLEDISRKLGTHSYHNGTTSAFNITDVDDIWTNLSAVDAHYGMSMVLDYFQNVHGRDGLNGEGGPFVSLGQDGVTPLFAGNINYSSNYNNAFWNGNTVFFGDGDGTSFSPLVTLDIIGHEMTHGVTENTAGLVYSGESGSLNESMSDVFGAMIERYARGESVNTWSMAEECLTPATPGDALRFLDDPHKASSIGDPGGDPDHYSERYRGQGDNQGVHVNSGIPNKAFYLLAKGGTHHLGGSMNGIGADDAAKIWYKALTSYMTPTTDFAGARQATESAATFIYGVGSTQLAAVQQAWCLVGVGQCGATEPPPAPTELQNNVPVPNLSGAEDLQSQFFMAVPTDASDLSFKINGGTGDADLYVKFGSPPTLTNYDCRPFTQGNNETCRAASPAPGIWYVMIRGFAPYSGVTLTGSYTVPSSRTDLIVNGGFEESASPWVLSGAAQYGTGRLAHQGTGFINLGQTNNATGSASQQVTIPQIAASANLSFYLQVTSDENTGNAEHDRLFVEVLNSSGRLLETLAVFSNLDDAGTAAYALKGNFNLRNYRGRTVRLQFRTTTNQKLPTTFRIDDVSLR